jgi:hypothetical protein
MNLVMKHLPILLLILIPCVSVMANDPMDFPEEIPVFEDPFAGDFPDASGIEDNADNVEPTFGDQDELSFEPEALPGEEKVSFYRELRKASRFTLKHEYSYKTVDPDGTVTNRDSLRLELAAFFWTYFFLQFDTKLNLYWGDDHKAKAEEEEVRIASHTKEAFLQASFGQTSIKAGIQVIIWGEADGGAITDVISPRDGSELFFISLEESRIGQPLIMLDQFTDWGDWSLFLIPDPEFNAYPEAGTAYYYDPFAGMAEIRDSTDDEAVFEYGLRWKKSFGKSDLAVMAASLIENDFSYRWDGYTQEGKMLITKTKQRFTLVGFTFNYAIGNFLFKGEWGKKTPQSFNDSSYQVVKKDVSDTALGVEYSPGGAYTVSLEAVNSHIDQWEENLLGITEDTNTVVATWSKTFLNEDLSLTWMSSYTTPFPAYFHSLRSSYQWDDHITLEFEAFYPDIRDEENSYWIYRDQKQVALKAQFQF